MHGEGFKYKLKNTVFFKLQFLLSMLLYAMAKSANEPCYGSANRVYYFISRTYQVGRIFLKLKDFFYFFNIWSMQYHISYTNLLSMKRRSQDKRYVVRVNFDD